MHFRVWKDPAPNRFVVAKCSVRIRINLIRISVRWLSRKFLESFTFLNWQFSHSLYFPRTFPSCCVVGTGGLFPPRWSPFPEPANWLPTTLTHLGIPISLTGKTNFFYGGRIFALFYLISWMLFFFCSSKHLHEMECQR